MVSARETPDVRKRKDRRSVSRKRRGARPLVAVAPLVPSAHYLRVLNQLLLPIVPNASVATASPCSAAQLPLEK